MITRTKSVSRTKKGQWTFLKHFCRKNYWSKPTLPSFVSYEVSAWKFRKLKWLTVPHWLKSAFHGLITGLVFRASTRDASSFRSPSVRQTPDSSPGSSAWRTIFIQSWGGGMRERKKRRKRERKWRPDAHACMQTASRRWVVSTGWLARPTHCLPALLFAIRDLVFVPAGLHPPRTGFSAPFQNFITWRW